MGKRFGIGFHFSDRIFKELKSLTQLAVWFIQIKKVFSVSIFVSYRMLRKYSKSNSQFLLSCIMKTYPSDFTISARNRQTRSPVAQQSISMAEYGFPVYTDKMPERNPSS